MFANLGTLTGVRFPGLTHPGIIGTAPSKELLQIWNDRERELEESGPQALKLCEVLHSRPLANLPSTKGCVLGKVRSLHAEGTKKHCIHSHVFLSRRKLNLCLMVHYKS